MEASQKTASQNTAAAGSASPFMGNNNSGMLPPKKKNIVPPEVQRSIMEWLDEDLPGDSPARASRSGGLSLAQQHQQAAAIASGGASAAGGRQSQTSPSPSGNAAGAAASTLGGGAGAGGQSYIAARGRSASPRSRGTRRQKQVEKFHVFVDNPDLAPVHPANSIWLYGSYEYKMQCPPEEAQRAVFRTIARLVDRMNRMLEASTAALARGDVSKEAVDAAAQAAAIEAMMPQPPSAAFAAEAAAGNKNKPAQPGLLPQSHPLQPAVAGGRFRAKGHLIFDIISTRKHIRSADYQNGLPYKLGEEIYEHCQRKYTECIATCFVGLTDNPASRVGRDIFYTKSDDLATSHGRFQSIDYSHLFVVFPPDNKRLQSGGHDGSGSSGEYDENNTRFLAEALSSAHDLAGSAIPGRPPPASSLRASSKTHQQHLAQQQLASLLVQQQAVQASGGDTTKLAQLIAAQLMAVHQMFAGPASPRSASQQQLQHQHSARAGAGAAAAAAGTAAAEGVATRRNPSNGPAKRAASNNSAMAKSRK